MRNFTCCFKFTVSLSDETSLFSLNDLATSEQRMRTENTGEQDRYQQLSLRVVTGKLIIRKLSEFIGVCPINSDKFIGSDKITR